MRLLVDYPRLPACEVCKKYLVNYSWSTGEGTGEPLMWESGPNEWKPIERQPNQPTPCDKCPKQSPEKEHEYVLTANNSRALQHYQEHRATGFRGLGEEEAADSMVRRNFVILNAAFDRVSSERQGDAAAMAVRQAFAEVRTR